MKRILVLFLCILFLSGCHAPTHVDSTDPIPVVPNNTENTSVDHTQILTVSVPISTEHFYADDGTEIFTTAQQYMKLLLPNDAVADRVILDFLNRVDAMQRDSATILLAAQENYSDNTDWYPYHQKTTYSPVRIDYGVLSLFGISSSYSGGVHSNQRAISANYDLTTGNVLTLASIMHTDADKEDFIQLVLEDLQKNTENYFLFDDYEETVRNLIGGDDTQYQDFYFTQTGLVFYFSPYDIAPYASGIITVEIPYSQLTGLLYNGYFPDEKDEGTGKMHIGSFNDMDMTQFTCMEEVMLSADEELVVLYPEGSVSDVRLMVSDNEAGVPPYTVFAAPQMGEKTAIVLGLPSENPLQITLQYSSNQQIHELTI